MTSESVFDKTCHGYLAEIAHLDPSGLEERLGVRIDEGDIHIPLLDQTFRITPHAVLDAHGQEAHFDVCIILCKYVLLAPADRHMEEGWAHYRDFKDTGPLTVYFANDVEHTIARRFAGKLEVLQTAAYGLGGTRPDMDLSYDLSVRFQALPHIAMLLLFNDGDAEFPAACSVLFEPHAGRYLDGECLAVLGRRLYAELLRLAG